jgi:PPM family protein phosphatase
MGSRSSAAWGQAAYVIPAKTLDGSSPEVLASAGSFGPSIHHRGLGSGEEPCRQPPVRRISLPFCIKACGRSDVGQVRRRNEDTMAVEPSAGMVVVADGMGGAPAGDLASTVAVQEVIRGLQGGEGMVAAISQANRRILEMVDKEPGLAGMGTTLTALLVSPETGEFSVGHVGDSRAYRWSRGSFSQITEDHTLVRELVRSGKILPQQEKEHPLAHVLSRAVGVEDVLEVEELEGVVEAGDRFLLCSDGLLKVMEDSELEEWVRGAHHSRLQDAVEGMVEEGNRRGAPDNITVALLAVEESPSS